jgi:hypothetical protein
MKTLHRILNIGFTALFLITLPLLAEEKAEHKAANKADATEAAKYYEQGKKLYDQKNYKEAFPLMLKSAEMGHSDAQMHVGKMYYNGWGVGHSHEKGKEWHQKAAKQGNKESIQKLYNMEHKTGSAH